MIKTALIFTLILVLFNACNQKPETEQDPFPYTVTEETGDREMSAAMSRSFENYSGIHPAENELYTQFKYTRLEGLDYHGHDGTISRRDPSKIIFENGKYYVWYTYRNTPTVPMGADKCNDTIPSTDWDLCEIWYATSEDGFTWEEQGVAVPRPPKPNVGWRSVSTTDILKWKGKYYLYYQGFLEASGKRGDYCPVAVSFADSPNGPWTAVNEIVIPNGPEGSWDQYAIHDPYPLVHDGKIYLYYKSAFNRPGNVWVAGGLAIAEDPLGPFDKHPLNPVLNSGHEVSLFPFKEGVAAIMVKDGNEHYTINYASDWVNFEIASFCELVPIAPGPFVPDAFTNTTDGAGVTWGLSHFTNAGKKGINQHSILARFDCDLSQNIHDPVMKQTGIWQKLDVYFAQGLNGTQKERNKKETELLVSGTAPLENPGSNRVEKQPNILFILIDDFGWMDVGYNGSTFYETPKIDQLSREWMRFDNCYTPSPMCSPTRTSILTGKHPARHGVTQWLPGNDKAFTKKGEAARVYCPVSQSPMIKESETTLGEAFQNAGYETAFYGKWHMGKLQATGGPANHGYAFQRAIIQENSCAMFYPFRGHPEYFPEAKEGDNFTDLLTDAAIEFVTKERENPFYLHLAHFAMHAPIASKPELRAKYQEKALGLPDIEVVWKSDEYSHKPVKQRQDNAEYAGELATLDKNIGRLIEALKASGLYENTIIVFTGDNGGRSCQMQGNPTSNVPLRTGKTFVFDGGLRTPLLIHWPGKTRAGTKSIVPVSSTDFYPTLLEMAGLPLNKKQHQDGVSLVPLVKGDKLERNTLYWHFPHYQGEGSYPASAIRVGDYKLIYNYHHNDLLLYNVVQDPYEREDLATQMPDRAKSLHKKLMKWLEETGAYIPKPISK